MAEPNSLTKDQLLAKFNEIDTDKNGSLSREEIDTFCASLPVPPSDSEITKVYSFFLFPLVDLIGNLHFYCVIKNNSWLSFS